MKENESHNDYYFDKFKKHLNNKEAKIYIALGGDADRVYTICVADGITDKQVINTLRMEADRLEANLR